VLAVRHSRVSGHRAFHGTGSPLSPRHPRPRGGEACQGQLLGSSRQELRLSRGGGGAFFEEEEPDWVPAEEEEPPVTPRAKMEPSWLQNGL